MPATILDARYIGDHDRKGPWHSLGGRVENVSGETF